MIISYEQLVFCENKISVKVFLVINYKKRLNRERWSLLITLRNAITPFMDVLAFIWLGLTVYDLVSGLTAVLNKIMIAVWCIFAVHFFIELILAPQKKIYLKHNMLTALSLILPAFRAFRFFRLFRYLRGLRSLTLVKILSTINRGMKALSNNLKKKVFIYVIGLTLMVVLTGAAGILNFEKDMTDYFKGFGSALWWSAMMVTTMGSDYFPKTAEGRTLAFILAVYGFAVFGYVAATFASYLMSKVQQEKKNKNVEQEITQLRIEIRELRTLMKKDSRLK